MHVKLELSYKLSEKSLHFHSWFSIIKIIKKIQKRNIMKKEYRELKDPVEINNFMKKWKEQNE